ncbi:dihydrolipoamide acetyltransferase family protein [Glaciibacter psychrotolerans]|uniref:Dihydrolipoamide acetyltransferase component of pyruvate dehydrogenase complex n=1 Tax=Glaciibacter psychrotolerans TaxID=670054 RepID=A0A7Z0J628_9MICO|nr:dihydrolipoamide acetyltransferase family protein [Leifsonia psychrotolerans]NYJ19955.1 pyruvate dehydrogenase E2 component (dihydrolipoamide acetyltransferase) [Leifsonia psychrotolerans]
MIRVFALPDLGEGLTESEIVAWHIAPGDTVTLNQHIADVETAKAVVELPSPYTGVVVDLHQPTGVVVQVGQPLVSFEVTDAAPPAVTEPVREPMLVGYGAAAESIGQPARRERRGTAAVAPAATGDSDAPAGDSDAPARERPRSTPPVRALARENGIDLASLSGTGPDGLICRDDVLAEIARRTGARPVSPAQGVASAAPGETRETRSPIKSVRKLTAAAMVQSAFTAPQVTEFLTIDVTPTLELLETLKHEIDFADVHLGILSVAAKALCLALVRTPAVNSRWDEEAAEIVQFHYVNLGIAVATARGLVVPTIPDAERLDLRALGLALSTLAEAARAGRTAPEALRGGTITITNIGVFGVDAGTPILNPGEAAILALGAIRRQPWEYRGEVALRQVMTLSLTFDHRLVDGEQGSRVLIDIARVLSNPARVLTMV